MPCATCSTLVKPRSTSECSTFFLPLDCRRLLIRSDSLIQKPSPSSFWRIDIWMRTSGYTSTGSRRQQCWKSSTPSAPPMDAEVTKTHKLKLELADKRKHIAKCGLAGFACYMVGFQLGKMAEAAPGNSAMHLKPELRYGIIAVSCVVLIYVLVLTLKGVKRGVNSSSCDALYCLKVPARSLSVHNKKVAPIFTPKCPRLS